MLDEFSYRACVAVLWLWDQFGEGKSVLMSYTELVTMMRAWTSLQYNISFIMHYW